MSSLIELFLSLLLLIHTGENALLTIYGTNPPTSGTITYPARIIGTDLNSYLNPTIAAAFNPDFYLGLVSLTIVGASIILKILQEQGLITATSIPGVKEFFLVPPYRHAWLSTGDPDLNPLGQDPENTTDDQLLDSFGKIYQTVQPGGTISIILPTWASTIGDRFQKLLTWTGFSILDSGTIYRAPGKPETQLRFKKPLEPQKTFTPTHEPEPTAVLAQAVETEATFPDNPPQLAVASTPAWGRIRMTRQEKAMLRSAVSIISKQKEPLAYHELLNQVYMELIERRVEFDSAREIESALLKHVGRELALVEETEKQGAQPVKRWSLGEEDLTPDHDRSSSVFRMFSGHHPRVPPVMRLLRKWQGKPKAGYSPRPARDEE